MKKVFTAIFASTILFGCGVSQTYDGPTKNKSELSEITSMSHVEYGLPSRYEHMVFLKVGEKDVGGYFMGYPAVINVLPGSNKITMEYQNNLDKDLLSSAFTTGAIGGTIDNATKDKHFIAINFTTEASHAYKVMFYPEIINKKNQVPKPWVIDLTTQKVVFGTVPEGVDPLTPVK